MSRKGIAILGSTGSIGTQTLNIIRKFPDNFFVAALSAGSNVELLASQIEEFRPKFVSIQEESHRKQLIDRFPEVEINVGDEGACAAAQTASADLVVMGIVGFAALRPTLSAVRAGKTIALANKEALIVGGVLVKKEAQRRGAQILPVDSEHNAIFQLLEGVAIEEVSSIVLTASGGPLLRLPDFPLDDVTPAIAVKHPNWSMGPKISVDSATLMNKGLEVIEAHYLFGLSEDRIEVWVHPQSIVHGALVLKDSGILAHLSRADMHGPIAHAMNYPHRLSQTTTRLSLKDISRLEFFEPDVLRFPALRLAREALAASPMHCIALNAANEVVVQSFLDGRVLFPDIPRVVEAVLSQVIRAIPSSLDEVFEADGFFRRIARSCLPLGR